MIMQSPDNEAYKEEIQMINEIIDLIAQKIPMHANNLRYYLKDCDSWFLDLSEEYLKKYVGFLKSKGYDLEYVVDSYLMMVKDIVIDQTQFLKTGHYRYQTLEDASLNVYNNSEYMFRYMIGVALSQFLWRNHRDMFIFFREKIQKIKGTNYLEIGSGHGLYFMEAISEEGFSEYQVVDISATSLDITRSFLDYCTDVSKSNVKFMLHDITKLEMEANYDFITMGEVLEHVENPSLLLQSLYTLLKPGGKAYISTCANCPVIDHIFLYPSVREIQDDITDAGFTIEDEIVISIDNIEESKWIETRANLSYACIVKK